MSIEGRIDGRELAQFAKDLRKVAPEMRKQLPRRLRQAVQPIIDDAKVNVRGASPKGQIKIGARSKLAGRNGASVKIVGRSPSDPALAGLLERGNKGAAAGAATFRHPVFERRNVFSHPSLRGNRNVARIRNVRWVDQKKHPYIQPAVDAHKDAVEKAVFGVVDDIKRELGAK